MVTRDVRAVHTARAICPACGATVDPGDLAVIDAARRTAHHILCWSDQAPRRARKRLRRDHQHEEVRSLPTGAW
jgi:hypothetical protein